MRLSLKCCVQGPDNKFRAERKAGITQHVHDVTLEILWSVIKIPIIALKLLWKMLGSILNKSGVKLKVKNRHFHYSFYEVFDRDS